MSATTQAKLPRVALVGTPNSGKTSLFNALTGATQKVGNYPGVTVEQVSGVGNTGAGPAEFVDVPGLYSLRAVSADERIASALLTGSDGLDAVVAVVEATGLERSLVLVSQVLETGRPVVVALTYADVVEAEGGVVNPAALEEELGCRVVKVLAFRGEGMEELREAVGAVFARPDPPRFELAYPQLVEAAVEDLVSRFALGGLHLARSDARRALLEDRPSLAEAVKDDRPELAAAVHDARAKLGQAGSPRILDAQARYSWAASVRAKAMPVRPARAYRRSDALDRVLTHRAAGFAVFVALMFLVFQSIYTLAAPLAAWVEVGIAAVQGWVRPGLAATPGFQSLVADGLVGGVGAALVFIPQIAILFLWIALLEGSGYLARAAFMMDKLFGWCGLNGRAFLPLMSSFACAVPGVMAARVLPDERSRLATVLVAPLMSCSARLPVYVLMVSAFVEPKYGPVWAGAVLFGMHAVGIAAAVPVAAVLNRRVLRSPRVPFVLEMPRYQWPRWRDVWITISSRVKAFLVTAGSIIVVLSVVIWALTYYPRSTAADARYAADFQRLAPQERAGLDRDAYVGQRRIADSYLGMAGRALEPAFVPAGFDWRLTTAIIAAFPAREVVVSAMGILFGMGEGDEGSEGLRDRLASATWPDGRALVTLPSALSLMVFFALCCQCMATLAAIRRETGNWKWPGFAFAYMTALAYAAAVAVYQLGTALRWS